MELTEIKKEIKTRFTSLDLLKKEKTYISSLYNHLEIKKEDYSLIITKNKTEFIPISSIDFKNDYNHFFQIAINIVKSLKLLHDKNMLHSNLKNEDIYIDDRNNAYLTNFVYSTVLNKKAAILTPIYFKNIAIEDKSPEQLGRINNIIDFRTDIYSLGLVFYKMLFRKNPFKGKDDLDSLNRVLTQTINNKDNIPENIFNMMNKLLQKDISKRYQSINGILHDLELLSNNFLDSIILGQKDISNKLQISDKVYGRQNELEHLTNCYYDVCKGTSKVIFVSGYSGVGKTSLIGELKNKILSIATYCISSKFDQYNKGKPYFGIKEAFDTLAKQILLKPENELEALKLDILSSLSGNGKILTDLVPHFEKIIGKQKDIQELPANENENRFHQTFLNLLKSIATVNTPLVLIVDDLQWIDFATLKLLENFINSDELPYLYLLCSYRDNEIEENVALQTILQNNKKVEILKLNSLDKSSLGDFLEDTLFLEKKEIANLNEEIYLKTGANPFFFRQFIYGLYNDGLIYFDEVNLKWRYHIEEIKKQNITENVADYILRKGLSSLDKKTLRILQIASVLGSKFDLKIVQKIDNISLETLIEKINEIFTFDYLLPLNVSSMDLLNYDKHPVINIKFLHDQIQQAVYSSIKEEELLQLHFKIGTTLLENEETQKNYFDILSHLNKTKEFFQSKDEKFKLINLNKEALYLAKNSTAYSSALTYTKIAKELLKNFNFDENYALALELGLNYIELLYLTGEINIADEEVNRLFKKIKSKEDEIDLRRLLTIQYTRIGRLNEAVEEGLKSLSLLDVHISKDVTMDDVGEKISEIGKMVEQTPFSKIVKLSQIEDKKVLKTLDVLMEMQAASYNSGSLVFPLTILELLKLTILNGNSYFSSYIYMMYALMNTKVLKNYKMAFEAAKYAEKLQKNINSDLLIARLNMMNSNFVMPWKNSLEESSILREKAFNQCLACGDYYWGIHSLIFGFYSNLMTIKSLDELLTKTKSVANLSKKIEQVSQYYLCNIQINFINLLNGKDSSFDGLDEYTDFEKKALKEYDEQSYMCGKYDFIVAKLMHGFMFEEYEKALKISLNENLDENSLDEGIFHEAFYKVFNILSIFSLKAEGKNVEKYDEFIKENISFIDIWEENGPDTFKPIKLLIKALNSFIENNIEKTMQNYEEAIDLAHRTNSIFLQALINEEYGKFWTRRGNKKIANIYFSDAIELYRSWKAFGKVKHLEAKISKNIYKDEKNDIDVDVIIKSSEIISSRIELEKFVNNILELVVKLSGADNGFMFFTEHDINIVAQIKDGKFTYQNELLTNELTPSNIISYVRRTKETLLINNTKDSDIAFKDKYVLSNNPKAILTLPLVLNNEVKAVIYLENFEGSNIFLDKDIQIIKHLSNQIVLSIENSFFYKQLEQKVDEKTRSLQDTLSLFDLGQSILFKWKNDENWTIEYLSNNVKTILGYEKSDFISSKIKYSDLIHEDDLERVLTEVDNSILNKDKVIEHEPYRLRDNHGNYLWVHDSTKILYDEDDKVDYFLGYVVDITKEKQREKLLSEQSKMTALEEMLGNIAHQWRQPLSAISTSISSLRLKQELDVLSKEDIDEVSQFVLSRTQNLSSTIELFSKLVSQNQISSFFNLRELIHDVLQLLLENALKYNINIKVEVDKNLRINTYKNMLFQVFYNCILNSIDAFEEQDNDSNEILIKVQKVDYQINIQICDNAGGIEEEIIKKVFEPYFTTKHKSQGKGLGLYNTQKIISEHLNGRIGIKNQNLDGQKGVCLKISFEES